jgi:quinol monooxygenase YgiN
MIALIVKLDIHEERLDEFLAAIKENATRTFADEPGCKYFDVTQDMKNPTRFIFYELYEDEAALEAHRAAPHFALWRRAAGRCVVQGSQVNTVCSRLFHHA